MSVTIESSPPLVALKGNPVRFRLSTDNNLETAGSVSVQTITFSSVGAADDSFTLSWKGYEIQFTCKASPDESGNQLPTSPANLNDWVAVVAGLLALNYYINADFVVSYSGSGLILTSRISGSSCVVSMVTDWTGTQPSLGTSGGVNEVPRTFFKLGLQTLILDGSEYVQIGEDVLPVDANAEASFDIRRLFADHLLSEFKYPEASDQLMIERTNICREYKVRYYEQFGETIVPQKMMLSSAFFVLNAGISHLQEAIYNRNSTSFWAKLEYNDYFLTWQPKTKLIDRYQTEKLYFLVQSSISALQLWMEVNYNDGAAQLTTMLDAVASPTVKGVYELALTLNTVQVAGYDDESIEYVRVWMEDGSSNRISEIRSYYVDYNPPENVRYFLFLNSLGGFDTLRATGSVTDLIEHERTDISKVLGEDFTEHDHQLATADITESKVYKASTGWKSAEDISWIRDFLLSRQAYQIIAGKLVPIVVTSQQATQRVDKEDLFAIDFEYRRAFKNEYYTKQIVHADFNDDFDDDFANE